MSSSVVVKIRAAFDKIKARTSPLFSQTILFLSDKPYFTSLLIALLITFPILLLFKVYFQLNDDYWALFILKGTVLSGAPSELNQLENVILCLGLKNLYVNYPSVQWYTWFFIFSQFLSLWAVLAAFQLGSHRFFKTCLFTLSAVALEIHFFDCLQWTMVAAVAGIGAVLLLAAVWRRGDRQYLPLALGLAFVLMAISVLIRYTALLLVLLVFVPAGFYLLKRIKMNQVRWAILGFLAVTAGLSLIAIVFDHDYYFRDPAWKNTIQVFIQHNNLIDLRNPVYDKTTQPVFDSIGWTENDLDLFKSHYFMDSDIYSAEKLQKLNDYFPQLALNKDSADSFEAMFLSLRTPLTILFFLALLPFLLEDFGFMAAYGTWTFLVLVFCQVYLKMPERVYLPCFFMQNNVAIFFASPKVFDFNEKTKSSSRVFKLGALYLSLIFLFTVYLVHLEYTRNRDWTAKAADLKVLMQRLNPRDNQLFVTWGSTFPYERIDGFDVDNLEHFKAISLAWFQRSPTTLAMMDRFKLKNLFRDMLENPNVFLICTPKQYTFYYDYMLEKYRLKTYGRSVFRSTPFNVYAIHRVRKGS